MGTTNQEKVSETKRCNVLKRGLAILLTISSLASCSPNPGTPPGSTQTNSPETQSDSTQTNSSSLFNKSFNLGGLKISLFGDARFVKNEIYANDGSVLLVRQARSAEQPFIVRNMTHRVIITPRGTTGYVKIIENVIDVGCGEGEIGFQFQDINTLGGKLKDTLGGKLRENQSISSNNFNKITSTDQHYLTMLTRKIDECMKRVEACPDDDYPNYRRKPQRHKEPNPLAKVKEGIKKVGEDIGNAGATIAARLAEAEAGLTKDPVSAPP